MAVLPTLPGLSVYIRIAGDIAVEYPNPDLSDMPASGPKISHYIESKPVAGFSIDAKVTPEFILKADHNVLLFVVEINGTPVATRGGLQFLRPNRRDNITLQSETIRASQAPTKPHLRNHVLFPAVKVDDADARSSDGPKASRLLGTIKVIIQTAKLSPAASISLLESSRKGNINNLGESLKGGHLSHRSWRPIIDKPRFPKDRYIFNNMLVGTFYFHFLSRALLQGLNLVPRDTPVPVVPGGDELDNLSEDEIRRLARERLRSFKTEDSTSAKREIGSAPSTTRPRKYVRLKNGAQAIDLTED